MDQANETLGQFPNDAVDDTQSDFRMRDLNKSLSGTLGMFSVDEGNDTQDELSQADQRSEKEV